MPPWRLIESPPSDIFFHMNLDRELFEAFLQNPDALPALRIYRVTEPAITVGRSWRKPKPAKPGTVLGGTVLTVPGVSRLFMTKLSPPEPSPGEPSLCVRPTGGGLVHHGNDLIYSVIARRSSFPTFRQVRTSYLSFHEAVQEAFQKLGIETRLFRCDDSRARLNSKRALHLDDCFHRPVPTDLALGDQKIAGAAQWRRGENFLHQGSLQLPEGISFSALKEALLGAFKRKFGVRWESNEIKATAVI